MADPRSPDPRDPIDASSLEAPILTPHAPYSDPAADPVIANRAGMKPRGGAGGWIAAAVIAVLVVIAAIAFTSGPGTDPGTTAVIPDQSDDAVPTPQASPAIPGTEVPPASPTAQPPAANQ